jgi:cell division septal protein FtsQ
MLKEQVIAARGGRGARGGGGDDRAVFVTTEGRAGKIMQRPSARRGGKAQDKRAGQQRAKSKRGSWRALLAWAPLAAKTLIAVCAGLVLFKGYRAAEASSFFDVRAVDVSGVSQASEEQIRQIVRHAASTGVWKADLNAISAEIERQPWVRSAVVTRVLPSGLRVRITERVPRVVVRMNSGRFVWIDDDAVAVGGLTPAQAQPAFFMRGFDEASTEAARLENRGRVKTFMTLAQEWESAGLASRVSELNLDDLHDVRAQLAGDDSQIEVRLGATDFTTRMKDALRALDTQRQTPRAPFITYIDMTQGKRAVLGFNPHAQAASAASLNETEATNTETTSGNTTSDSATNMDATAQGASAHTEQQHRTSPEAKSTGHAKTEAHEAKSDAKDKREKLHEGAHKGGEQAVEQSHDGGGRPRRVTKGE